MSDVRQSVELYVLHRRKNRSTMFRHLIAIDPYWSLLIAINLHLSSVIASVGAAGHTLFHVLVCSHPSKLVRRIRTESP
jgi:hypothetical protein